MQVISSWNGLHTVKVIALPYGAQRGYLTLHCLDIKITPHDSNALGAGLFDSPSATFVTEMIIFFLGFGIYAMFTPMSVQTGFRNNPNLLKIIFLVMTVQQAMFCFGS